MIHSQFFLLVLHRQNWWINRPYLNLRHVSPAEILCVLWINLNCNAECWNWECPMEFKLHQKLVPWFWHVIHPHSWNNVRSYHSYPKQVVAFRAVICCQCFGNVRKPHTLHNSAVQMDSSCQFKVSSFWDSSNAWTRSCARASCACPTRFYFTIRRTSIPISVVSVITVKLKPFTVSASLHTVTYFNSSIRNWFQLKSVNAWIAGTFCNAISTVSWARSAWSSFLEKSFWTWRILCADTMLKI